MLTQENYCLLKLAEEAMEVAHMAAKTIQFGKNECSGEHEGKPVNYPPNQERLQAEINDLLRWIKELNDEHGYSLITDLTILPKKETKLVYYFDKSVKLGFVEPTKGWLVRKLLKL